MKRTLAIANLEKSEKGNSEPKRRSTRNKVRPLKYWCNEWRKFNFQGELYYDSSPKGPPVSYSSKRNTKHIPLRKITFALRNETSETALEAHQENNSSVLENEVDRNSLEK